MIIECEQCRTKFKLDDEKVSDRGVRVRCARCRHVFTVRKPEPEPVPVFVAPEPEVPAFAAADETVLMTSAPATQVEIPTSFAEEPTVDFSFNEIEATSAPETGFDLAQTDASPVAPQMDGFDFGEVSFAEPTAEESQPVSAQPWGDETVVMAPPKQEEPQPESGFDFGTAEPQIQPEPAFGGGFDFGTVIEPAAVEESATNIAFDFGDAAPIAAPAQTPAFDFTSKPLEAFVAAPASGADVDFGSFDFGDVSVAKPDDGFAFDASGVSNTASPAQSPAADVPASDFAFSFDDAQTPQPATPPAGGEFGFSFDDAQVSQPAAATGGGAGEFGFSFDDAAAPKEEVQHEGSFDLSGVDFGVAASGTVTTAAAPQPADNFSFGEMDFGGDVAPVAVHEASVDKDSAALFTFGDQPVAPLAQPVAPAQEFTFGPAAEQHEEAPPLSISSRRRDSSALTIIIGIVVLLVVAVLGYVGFQMVGGEKSAGMFGKAAPAEDGRITIQNQTAYFLPRTAAGELLVINGEAVNNFKKSRAALQVKGMLYAQGNNTALVTKVVFAGNPLTHEQLMTMPKEKIEAAMNNQFGDSLANLEVQPGKAIPFTIVILSPPANAKDYSVEPVASTVAAAGK